MTDLGLREAAEVSDNPTGIQGDAYPQDATPDEFKVGALYKNKPEKERKRVYEQHKSEIADQAKEDAPLLTPAPEVYDPGARGVQATNRFTLRALQDAMPNLPADKAREYFPLLKRALVKWKMHGFERVAQFLGTLSHESADLYYWKEIGGESMHYAPYYGRGPIQITWKENYKRIGDAIGQDLVRNPDLLYRPEIGFDAACAFYSGVNPQRRDLRVECDWGNFETIMWTVLGAVDHPSYYDRWNRYIRAGRSLPIPFSVTGTAHNNFERCLMWMWPLVGQMPYGWWLDGPVPDGAPAFAVNKRVPSIEWLMQQTIFCIGPINLARRHCGKAIPTAGNELYDGGTVALWAFWSQFLRPFDIQKNYPHGTIIFRRFRDVNDQGHGAVILGNWRVLQSFDGNEPLKGTTDGPGLNARYTADASHAGGYYEYALFPPDWINHNVGKAAWAT